MTEEAHAEAMSPEELHLRMIRFESKCGELAIGDGCYDPMQEDELLPPQTTQEGSAIIKP